MWIAGTRETYRNAIIENSCDISARPASTDDIPSSSGKLARPYPNGCVLIIVCSRSGPVEMMSIGTPASASMRAR